MGYHKQQLIADQVEVGDRVPAPKSASSHLSLRPAMSRRELREVHRWNNLRWRFITQRRLSAYRIGIALLALIAIVGWLR